MPDQEMEWTGVVQPSKRPWSSTIVIVHMKDWTYRFCVDYRGLNAVTSQDKFPPPRSF